VLGDLDSWAPASSLPATISTFAARATLLGDEQSGHIREVGFELYQSMLEDAILAAKAGHMGWSARQRPQPADHHRCADHDPGRLRARPFGAHGAVSPPQRCRRPALEIEGLAAEMIDRFGPLPRTDAKPAKAYRDQAEPVSTKTAHPTFRACWLMWNGWAFRQSCGQTASWSSPATGPIRPASSTDACNCRKAWPGWRAKPPDQR
jgi:transcription-repair coupling factor (superfamily II helicase)